MNESLCAGDGAGVRRQRGRGQAGGQGDGPEAARHPLRHGGRLRGAGRGQRGVLKRRLFYIRVSQLRGHLKCTRENKDVLVTQRQYLATMEFIKLNKTHFAMLKNTRNPHPQLTLCSKNVINPVPVINSNQYHLFIIALLSLSLCLLL